MPFSVQFVRKRDSNYLELPTRVTKGGKSHYGTNSLDMKNTFFRHFLVITRYINAIFS